MTNAHYEAWNEGGRLLRLSTWDSVVVSGSDAQTFLHKFCTNDVQCLAPGQGCEAFFNDVKGRIVAHGFVLRELSQLQLVLPAGNIDALTTHLERYVIREQVCFHRPPQPWKWFLLHYAASLAIDVGRELHGDNSHARWGRTSAEGEDGDEGLLAVRCAAWGAKGLVVAGSEQSLAQDSVLGDAPAQSIEDASLEETLRIEAGWPQWGIDFNRENLPQEVDRDVTAISFKKGCYLGQETVARLDALGHVNRQLRRATWNGAQVPDVPSELFLDGALAGVVTSACWSPERGAPLAWVMFRRGALDPPGTYSSHWGDATLVDPA